MSAGKAAEAEILSAEEPAAGGRAAGSTAGGRLGWRGELQRCAAGSGKTQRPTNIFLLFIILTSIIFSDFLI